MAYSVLTEPIIPVVMPDGSNKRIGIREALLQAHTIKDIICSNPLERYAVLRLLIVFAMDAYDPKDSYARKDLFDEGKFDETRLDAYFAECEKNGPRFDLFDSEHPFLQSKYDEKLDVNAKKSVANIIHYLPSGNNHIFLDHRLENSHQIEFHEAFMALCASYVFCVSGLAGPSCVNNTPPLYVTIIGDNLFETIVLNMISEAEAKPLEYGAGEVPWRQEKVIVPKKQVASVSLLEGLTWQPRRITLIRDPGANTIRNIYYQPGLDFRGDDLWNDPHVPKFRKKDDSFGTVKPDLAREVWRDAGTLLYDHDSKHVRQPLALRCMGNIYDEDDLPDWVRLRTAGLVTNQAAYTGWNEGELSLPTGFILNQEKANLFRDDIQTVEKLQANIYTSVQRYVDKPRTSGDSDEYSVAIQCRQKFLQMAHDLLFGDMMQEINVGVREEEHINHFCMKMMELIRDLLATTLRVSGNSTKTLMKQIEAEKWIWIGFDKIAKERKEQYGGT